jgi:metal-responsive CopG/Arc/MetJ family transcriptional regulator
LTLDIKFDIIYNIVIDMELNMTALSISLPDNLAIASQKAARQLGISRIAFIRQAIQHELEALAKHDEQQHLARALLALQTDPHSLQEMQVLEESAFPPLPDEEDEWWKS